MCSKLRHICLLGLLFMSLHQQVFTQVPKLFEQDEIMHISIYADMDALLHDIGEERDYHNGLLLYQEPHGELLKFDIELKTRGNFRRRADVCPFPPIKINFEKDQIKNTLFEGADKIKLVTHCNNLDRSAEDYLMSEYLAYRIFNQLHNTSHRVRLVKVQYHDILRKYKQQYRYAFFVEKAEQVADRTDLQSIESDHLNMDHLNMNYYQLVSVFQFLIGNTDWSVMLPKNISPLVEADSTNIFIAPYDFDLSFLVRPSYIDKNPGMDPDRSTAKIKAYSQSLDDFQAIIQVISGKKEAILKSVKSFGLLGNRQKKHILKFLEDRFDILEDPDRLPDYFEEYCYD